MIILKNIKTLFGLIFLSLLICSNFSFANNENVRKILSQDDIKIYKKIFEIQKLPIKSKKSKEWKKVDNLIKRLNNKILLGNVYAERYLHPTGWRSSYTDLKNWLDKYNDHPDATRITRIALKRKPKNSKNPKKPTPALVVKTNGSDFSLLDKVHVMKNMKSIKERFNGVDNLPNVYLLHGDLTVDEMAIMYNHPKIKAFLTCTHGEGFGRPMLEASCCDLPVIAPNWSGHLDFLNASESLLIQGKLKKVPKSMVWKPIILEQAQWYSVNEKDIKRKLRLFYNNHSTIKNKAVNLGKKNRKKFSLNNMASQFNKIIDDVLKDIPQQVELKLPKLKKIGGKNKLKLPKLKKA